MSDCPRKKAADDRKREMRENRDRMTDKRDMERQEKSRAGNNNNADNQAQGGNIFLYFYTLYSDLHHYIYNFQEMVLSIWSMMSIKVMLLLSRLMIKVNIYL